MPYTGARRVALTGRNQRVEVGRSLYAQVRDAAASFQIVLRQQLKARALDFARGFCAQTDHGATPAVLRPTCRAPRLHAHLDALATHTQYAHATLMR
jgi:hypothetical protein